MKPEALSSLVAAVEDSAGEVVEDDEDEGEDGLGLVGDGVVLELTRRLVVEWVWVVGWCEFPPPRRRLLVCTELSPEKVTVSPLVVKMILEMVVVARPAIFLRSFRRFLS